MLDIRTFSNKEILSEIERRMTFVNTIEAKLLTPYEIAQSLIGLKEDADYNDSNPEITKMFKYVGYDLDDDTPWCKMFVDYCIKKSGCETVGDLTARSGLKYGEFITLPELGDLVIFWRESKNSYKGHIGFYAGEVSGSIRVLGGNQNNKVCYKYYPVERLLGYRRLF